jgi:hypothetical protein
MPTPDASQFTSLKKLNAVAVRRPTFPSKNTTHLSVPVPRVTGLRDFLPKINAVVIGIKTPIKITLNQAKPKVNNRY